MKVGLPDNERVEYCPYCKCGTIQRQTVGEIKPNELRYICTCCNSLVPKEKETNSGC